VEETIRGSKGHAIVGANGLGQASLLEQALKGGKSTLFLDGLPGFTEQKITAGVVRDGKGVAISFVPEHELALVVGAPQSIGSASFG
jgi:Fe-S cluster assembly ATPase SufC